MTFEEGGKAVNIDKFGRVPIYEQIISEVEKQVLSGAMKPMDQLPSVRALSVEISINPNTIQKAYSELERLGVCYSAPGQGRFVAVAAAEKIRNSKSGLLAEIIRLTEELVISGMPLEEILTSVSDTVGKKRRGNSKR